MNHFIVIALLISLGSSCQRTKNIETFIHEGIDSSRIKKEVFIRHTEYSFYDEKLNNIDSIKSYYNTSNSLKDIRYNGSYSPVDGSLTYPNNVVNKGYYENGERRQMRFYKEFPQELDTMYITFHTNSTVELLNTIVIDSCIYPQLSTSYFSNGKIQNQGLMDMYNVEIVPTGLWKRYNVAGFLEETTLYHPAEKGKGYIIIKTFNEKGDEKSVKIYNNYVQEESGPKELKKIP